MARLVYMLVLLLGANPLRAIETSGGYVTTAPTSSEIPNWDSGWATGSITGWNYVGTVNGSSGVYVGNGWVLTAGHVGVGNFTLGGVTYVAVANSSESITTPASSNSQDTGGTADLIMFQIAAPPDLPQLTISDAAPVAFASNATGTPVAMLGFGGEAKLSWGYDTVTEIGEAITPTGFTYISTDFLIDNGTVDRGSASLTNNSNVVDGDSGGGDFSFNSTTQKWELSGINEVSGSYSDYSGTFRGNGTFSGMVQLDVYASQINTLVASTATVDTPTMPLPALVVLGGLLLIAAVRSPARVRQAVQR